MVSPAPLGLLRPRAACLAEGPQPVGQLAAGLPVSRPAVSQHLKILKDAGLVEDVAAGTRRIYRLNPVALAALRDQPPWSRRTADMAPIVTSATIDHPAEQVFAYATDPARFKEWQKGVVDGHMDGPASGTRTPAVGAKCVTTRRIGGANRPSTSILTHIDPPSSWGVRGTDGPIRAALLPGAGLAAAIPAPCLTTLPP